MAVFGPKPWVNPFKKVSILPLFELLVFIVQKGIFFVLEYRKRHFPGLCCLKKKLEKWPFLDQNHGLTPLEKCLIIHFSNFLFLQPKKSFLRSRTSQKTFSWPILPKKRKLEKCLFFDQNQVLTPLEKCQFFDFCLLVYLA